MTDSYECSKETEYLIKQVCGIEKKLLDSKPTRKRSDIEVDRTKRTIEK